MSIESKGEQTMADYTGKVKYYSEEKGFGYIAVSGHKDVILQGLNLSGIGYDIREAGNTWLLGKSEYLVRVGGRISHVKKLQQLIDFGYNHKPLGEYPSKSNFTGNCTMRYLLPTDAFQMYPIPQTE